MCAKENSEINKFFQAIQTAAEVEICEFASSG